MSVRTRNINIAARSAGRFLVLFPWLRLRHDRIGRSYGVADGSYRIFRETENVTASGETVILVIGFRLKLIRSNPLAHWLFQRICILTTPFWSGIAGFRTKLWMVDPQSKDYMGIYDWRGKAQAQGYIDFLIPILRFFSVPGSVWAEQLYGLDFENYLQAHALPVYGGSVTVGDVPQLRRAV
jgi:hypothetical protein